MAPPQRGEYVLYWMQASHRVRGNDALTHAVHLANELRLPVLIGLGLADDLPEGSERHYAFVLEGLRDVSIAAKKMDVGFVVRKGSPDRVIVELAERASIVVVDRGYLRAQREWREGVAQAVSCQVVEVESEVVVPIDVVSDKEEYAARTIRPKIHRAMAEFLVPSRNLKPKVPFDMRVEGLDVDDVDTVLAGLRIDRSVGRVGDYVGGEREAWRRLRNFNRKQLGGYATDRNDPNLSGISNLSPYLHFGQISCRDIALEVRKAGSPEISESVDAFLEELIVRRELSINLCVFQPDYDRYSCLPEWAQLTLDRHREDPREYLYSLEQFEKAKTHDPYWNAAQVEMTAMGKMHGYMRMYWGKKIIEWSALPEEAFETALYLNNKYELDGRDANSFTGVAWCFGKHDRPWQERPVFGTVRYMNANGLRRKFDVESYVRKVEERSDVSVMKQGKLF